MSHRYVAFLALSGLFLGCAALSNPTVQERSGRDRSGERLERARETRGELEKERELEQSGEMEKGGEHRKQWSGVSYRDQTRIEALPHASSLSAGFDSERVWSGYDDWEPALAVDPGSSYVYQLTTRYGVPQCSGCADANIAFRRSADGGATWESDRRLLDSRLGQFDPLLEVAADGTLVAAFMLSYTPGVMVSRSTDHGTTWSQPVAVGNKLRNPWSDKPVLAISRDGKDVYVAFNTSDSYVAASHDGGLTFAQPVKTNRDQQYYYDYQGAVAPDGSIYFANMDVNEDFSGAQNLNVVRSTNKGRTWTTTRLDTSAESPECAWAPGCYKGFFAATTALAIDINGTIMFAYTLSSADGGPTQLYVRTSPDGVNWNERQRVSSTADTVTNLFPVLAAGPAPGDFRLSWQDDRMGADTSWNTWYKATSNGGSSWSADVRLSDLGSGAPYKGSAGYSFPYGDYYEMAVDSIGTTHILWGEGSSWDGPGGVWYTRGR